MHDAGGRKTRQGNEEENGKKEGKEEKEEAFDSGGIGGVIDIDLVLSSPVASPEREIETPALEVVLSDPQS